MTEESTLVEETTESSNKGTFEWLKLIIFVGAILLISYLAISVISPILFRDYVPDIMGLDQTSGVTEPIVPSEAEAGPSDSTDQEGQEGIEGIEGIEGAVEETVEEMTEETSDQAVIETEPEAVPLPAEENQPAKTDSEAQTEIEPETTHTTHIVQRGETLTSIAAAYGITVQELLDINELVNPNFLYAGQEINVPN